MVFPGNGFRNQDGDEGFSGDGRCVPIVQDKAEGAFQQRTPDEVFGLGGIHFDLAVQARPPRIGPFGIVLFPGGVQAAQDGPDVTVVRPHEGGLQLP